MQTSYSNQPSVGIAGSLRNGTPHRVTTHHAEGSTVAGGLAVIAGTAEQQAKVPAAPFARAAFLGVVLHQPERASQAYAAAEQLAVAREGCVLVAYEPDAAPTPNTQAFVRHTANGAGKLVLGALRANADGGAVALTVVTTSDAARIDVEINGTLLSFVTGLSQTAAQKATAFAAYVDGLAAFAATASGAVVTITPVSGAAIIGAVPAAEVATVADASKAAPVPGGMWRRVFAADGLAELELSGAVREA